jgi:alpha-D-ribose 1-methylphosphonate 5-triphosphate diphosphatase
MTETILTNARIVTADRIVERGTLVAAGGRIRAVEPGPAHGPGATDLDGDTLIPGLVELHTDNLEKHFSPRPGVRWPVDNAVLAHDAQIIASGITTVLDSVAVGDIGGGGMRIEGLEEMLGAIRSAQAAGHTRAEHLLHIRCEISFESTGETFRQLAGTPLLRLVSIMDHTPGQRQFVDAQKLRVYYTRKYQMNETEFAAFVAARHEAHQRFSARHRREIVALAREHGYALASHDDATAEHVAEAIADGMTLAEFPTTREAATASREGGLAVLVGGPNLVLGRSHSGNISARELVDDGLVDVISSDYVPASALQSVWALAEGGLPLADAVRMATLTPARAVGLDDRGELAPGKRADWVRVRRGGGVPVVREVWRAGERVL